MNTFSTAASLPLPRWAYVPGESADAEADHDTLWHAKALVPSRFRDFVPARHPALRYGIALNDAGYFWESHEVLEAVWAAAPQGGRERILLRACIQIASANLKLRMQKPHAAARLLGEALAELRVLERAQGRRRRRICRWLPDRRARGVADIEIAAVAALQGRLGADRRCQPDMKQNADLGRCGPVRSPEHALLFMASSGRRGLRNKIAQRGRPTP